MLKKQAFISPNCMSVVAANDTKEFNQTLTIMNQSIVTLKKMKPCICYLVTPNGLKGINPHRQLSHPTSGNPVDKMHVNQPFFSSLSKMGFHTFLANAMPTNIVWGGDHLRETWLLEGKRIQPSHLQI